MNKHVRFFGSHQFNTMSTSYSVHELSLVLNALLLVAVSFLLLSRKNTPASAGTSETPNNKKSGLGPKASRPVLAASNANGKNNSKDQGARIGVIYSPFRRKSGCPRQPGVGKTCRSIIKLDKEMDVCLLQGLEDWSYVWLLWDFDKRVLPGNGSIKSLVQPPRAPIKVGVFACRTPHRPIALGLSLAKVIKIDGKRVYIEGSDVVHNTTLLDIKPYHHSADSPWDEDLRQPTWVGSVSEKAFDKTTFSEQAREKITAACLASKLQFWKLESDLESLFGSITDLVCNQDMRSQWRRGSQIKFVMDFDNLLLTLNYSDDEVHISDVEVVKKIRKDEAVNNDSTKRQY